MAGIDGDLVRERCERGEDAGAAHDDPVLGIAGLVQRDRVVDEVGVGRPVDRRMDDRVGERDVLERQLALEGDEVGVTLDVGAVRALPPRPFPGETGERHVHVVGGAAHQPHRRLGDAGQPFVAALQIGLRPRDHVADVDLLAGLRVVHQALRPALELPIEDRRHRFGGLGERGMIGDVADSFVADPDVRPAGGQRLQELVSGPRPHGQPSLRIAR